MTSPLDRSRAALPYNIRKTLEESNLPVEVAVAIADELDRLRAGWIEADRIALEARIRDAKQARPEAKRVECKEHEFDEMCIFCGKSIREWIKEQDSPKPQRSE